MTAMPYVIVSKAMVGEVVKDLKSRWAAGLRSSSFQKLGFWAYVWTGTSVREGVALAGWEVRVQVQLAPVEAGLPNVL